jgi:hypothetical protein
MFQRSLKIQNSQTFVNYLKRKEMSSALCCGEMRTRLLAVFALVAGCGFRSVGTPDGGGDGGRSSDGAPADLGSDDGQVSFTEVLRDADAGTLNAIWGARADDIYAAGDEGALYHYDGAIWASAHPPSYSANFTGVWGSAADDIWLVGVDQGDGIVYHSDGLSWTLAHTVPGAELLGVWGVGNQLWVVGADGLVVEKDGATWGAPSTLPLNPALMPGLGQPILRSPAGTGADFRLIPGDADALYYDTGSGWSGVYRPNDSHFFVSAWGAPGATHEIFVGANHAGLWRFGDDHQPHVLYESPPGDDDQVDLWGVSGTSAGHVVLAGATGRVILWDGSAARTLLHDYAGDFYGVWLDAPDRAWIVGAPQLIVRARLPAQ